MFASAGTKRSIDVVVGGGPPDGANATSAGKDDMLQIIPLGAGSEVGRSCIVASYKGKSVMFDCGVHPGYAGIASLPYFDEVDLSTVDALLVTHFHLDHCAAVPFLVGHTNFKGRILMTHPTKAIYNMQGPPYTTSCFFFFFHCSTSPHLEHLLIYEVG